MNKMTIEEPHGYFKDAEGKIVLRFGGWEIGQHDVPDSISSVEYVKSASAHDEPVAEEYRPQSE